MTNFASRWPPFPLTPARYKTGKPALSDLLAVLAGNLLALVAHTYGEEGAPRNPNGGLGHDHSGGDFGTPLTRSVVTFTTSDGTLYSANVEGGVTDGALELTNDAGGELTRSTQNPRRPIWVPNCDRLTGAFVELQVSVTLEVVSTSLQADDDLSLLVAIDHPDHAPQGNPIWTSITIPTPSSTGTHELVAATDIAMKVGALQDLSVRLEVDRAAGGSSRGCLVVVHEIELG